LLDEPDAHSRRLYPTLKLADYGLAYSIPNAAVRNLKRAMVSGGTEGYQAPEISYKVRSDPSQTPDPIASPASDVYSIGCVVLDFIRTAWDRYKHAEQMILELNYPFAYKYFPYSKNLVDLARISTNSDSRLRPTPKQLFDITLKYGTLSYNAIAEPDGPELARNAYPGMVMWNKRLQRRFRDNAVFRHAVLKMDWFSQNERALQKLYVVATQPGEESRPLEGRVAIGNGLGGFEDFRTLYQKYRHLDQKQWLGIMHLYDSAGNEIPCPKDRPFLGLIAQNRLQPPPQDEDWRSKRPDAKPAVYKIYK
jgi:serine/threonine protein kinase